MTSNLLRNAAWLALKGLGYGRGGLVPSDLACRLNHPARKASGGDRLPSFSPTDHGLRHPTRLSVCGKRAGRRCGSSRSHFLSGLRVALHPCYRFSQSPRTMLTSQSSAKVINKRAHSATRGLDDWEAGSHVVKQLTGKSRS
jgi:hypothetical protein